MSDVTPSDGAVIAAEVERGCQTWRSGHRPRSMTTSCQWWLETTQAVEEDEGGAGADIDDGGGNVSVGHGDGDVANLVVVRRCRHVDPGERGACGGSGVGAGDGVGGLWACGHGGPGERARGIV